MPAGFHSNQSLANLTDFRSWNGFLRFLGAQFLHGIVIFFLLLCHENVFSSQVKTKQNKTKQQLTDRTRRTEEDLNNRSPSVRKKTYLCFLLVEVVNDDPDEEVQCEE